MSPFFLRDLPISKHADLKRKKIFFLGPPHREKIILSRRQPWSIKHLKIQGFMDLRDLRFHSLRDLPLQACCLERQKILFWAPTNKRNLIYQILQHLLFHRFVYKV